jgi:hypothetical protein
LHDTSWGTKGDHKICPDLGTVNARKNEVEVSVVAEKDTNDAYQEALSILDAPSSLKPKGDPTTQQGDYSKQLRTK